MEWYVYVLHFDRSVEVYSNGQAVWAGLSRDRQHYVGITTDFERRLAEHISAAGARVIADALRDGVQIDVGRLFRAKSRSEARTYELWLQTRWGSLGCQVCNREADAVPMPKEPYRRLLAEIFNHPNFARGRCKLI